MIAGGVFDVERSCENYQETILTRTDYNHDGIQDRLVQVEYDQKKCEGWESDTYIELGTKEGEPLFLGRIIHTSHPFTPGFRQFGTSSRGLWAAGKDGDTPFHVDDLVEAPLGHLGRIDSFIFELDPNDLLQSRTIVEMFTPRGMEFFDLSALTLISPAVELERQADVLIKQFRNTKDFRRREELLRYAGNIYGLKEPFQKEARSIEEHLALAFENRIARLDLDPKGKRILLDKMGEKLGFHFRATRLAWDAREKLTAK